MNVGGLEGDTRLVAVATPFKPGLRLGDPELVPCCTNAAVPDSGGEAVQEAEADSVKVAEGVNDACVGTVDMLVIAVPVVIAEALSCDERVAVAQLLIDEMALACPLAVTVALLQAVPVGTTVPLDCCEAEGVRVSTLLAEPLSEAPVLEVAETVTQAVRGADGVPVALMQPVRVAAARVGECEPEEVGSSGEPVAEVEAVKKDDDEAEAVSSGVCVAPPPLGTTGVAVGARGVGVTVAEGRGELETEAHPEAVEDGKAVAEAEVRGVAVCGTEAVLQPLEEVVPLTRNGEEVAEPPRVGAALAVAWEEAVPPAAPPIEAVGRSCEALGDGVCAPAGLCVPKPAEAVAVGHAVAQADSDALRVASKPGDKVRAVEGVTDTEAQAVGEGDSVDDTELEGLPVAHNVLRNEPVE